MIITKKEIQQLLDGTKFILKDGYAQINYGYTFICVVEKYINDKNVFGSYEGDFCCNDDGVIKFTFYVFDDVLEKRYISFDVDFLKMKVCSFIHNSLKDAMSYNEKVKQLIKEVDEDTFEVLYFDMFPSQFIEDLNNDRKLLSINDYSSDIFFDFEHKKVFCLNEDITDDVLFSIEVKYDVKQISFGPLCPIKKSDDYVIDYFYEQNLKED